MASAGPEARNVHNAVPAARAKAQARVGVVEHLQPLLACTALLSGLS